ncbi:MAG: hypothetical protein HY842_17660 [Bacteroidetes bacterium]|nr:hypothetical protein [Bacteroidota bacterium]
MAKHSLSPTDTVDEALEVQGEDLPQKLKCSLEDACCFGKVPFVYPIGGKRLPPLSN